MSTSPKDKKNKKRKKVKISYKMFLTSILAVVFLSLLFFVFWPASKVPEHQINISSENPKQGSTILIRVSNKYPAVSGFFAPEAHQPMAGNSNKSIIFFKNGKYSNWSSLLGIDADLAPGKYKISINAFGETLEKEINVEAQNFPLIKMPITKKIIENIKNKDNPNLDEVLKKFTPTPYFNSPFYFPLNKIQESGLVFGELIKGSDYQIQHFGVDLRAQSGTKVYSVNVGKVVLVKNLSNYGNTVIIDHGLGIFSLYLHLDEFRVSTGQIVEKGQIIGLSGNTGYSTAPHLHFSIRDNGARIDPISFIKATEKTNENFNLASIKEALTKFLWRLF